MRGGRVTRPLRGASVLKRAGDLRIERRGLTWILSKVDLSLAYPFVGVSFIVVMLFGAFLLNETITPLRMIGTILIAAGCIFVARS